MKRTEYAKELRKLYEAAKKNNDFQMANIFLQKILTQEDKENTKGKD